MESERVSERERERRGGRGREGGNKGQVCNCIFFGIHRVNVVATFFLNRANIDFRRKMTFCYFDDN